MRRTDEILIRKTTTDLPYTIIANFMVGSTVLSFESKGLLCLLLSLPMDWVVTKKWILKEFPVKRAALDKSFKQLEEVGYLVPFDIVKRNGGKFSGRAYMVHPKSIFYDDQVTYAFTDAATRHRLISEKTDAVLPYTVKQHLQTKEYNKLKN